MDREFYITVNDRKYKIKIEGNSLLVDDQPFVMGYENGILTIDGINYDVSLGQGSATVDGTEYPMSVGGLTVSAPSLKTKVPKKKTAHASANAVVAIMPGSILKVLVAEGDSIQEGQVVLILEAMKMENEIHAHRSGRVAKVHVQPGDSVENGQVLVEIE